MNYIICHYDEIGLKGKNRKFFEEKLVKNIKMARLSLNDDKAKPCHFNSSYFKAVRRISGRILVELTEAGIKNQKKISCALKNVFGIAYFTFAIDTKQDIKSIQNQAYQLLKDKKFKSFRISTKRSNKKFPLNSQKINENIGAFIVKKLKKGVNLEKPNITCFIEIVEKFAFLYLEKINGPGGLPVGVSGKAALLLSGGIDSPVAAYYIMKRGVELIFIHFHAGQYTSKASLEKIDQLIKILSKFQHKPKLHLVPFDNIQKEILLKTPEKLRIILYRRFMIRIAQEIAKKEGAISLVTGESIGQVASQTLENLKVIEEVSDMPILRPLVGFDKQEIIKKAREIGTYEISILPHQDCCVRFLPKHPETKAKLIEIKKAEEKLNISKLIDEARF